jgi:hypothetical protein
MIITSAIVKHLTKFNQQPDYALEKINSIELEKLIPFFEELPADPYLQENYRFRRLSRFQLVDNRLIKLPHSPLFQTQEYNPLLGNVVRDYPELRKEMIELEDFQKIVREFGHFCQINSTSNEIGVHQIRTTASMRQVGKPAPEGIHRDGVDVVGIFCVNREGIEGGTTFLYPSPEENPTFSKILNGGEFLLFNDRQFFHFTSPIQALSPERGVRDVFVLTSPGLIAPKTDESTN